MLSLSPGTRSGVLAGRRSQGFNPIVMKGLISEAGKRNITGENVRDLLLNPSIEIHSENNFLLKGARDGENWPRPETGVTSQQR